ncbi:MAG TPA: hypothetical protein EYG03_10050 [Planctomycetes bacterium]|nr:hypothetical protein [Planctomycetota bacterium]
MIWPFRPHPPLPLASKVECERRFATVARMLGRHRIPSATVIAPHEIDAIVADCDHDNLPARLFAFVESRLALPGQSIDVDWDDTDDLTVNGQTLHYRFVFDDAGQVTAIGLHPEVDDLPYRLAAVTAVAAAEYFIKTESLAESVPKGTFEILPLFFGFGPVMANAALREAADQLSVSTQMPWEKSRVGTLSPLEIGYSMALADWSLDAGFNDVASLLRLDAREGLEKGLRFLRKTVDCSFEQDFLDRSPDNSVGFRMTQLRHDSGSMQLGAMMDLHAADEVDPDLIDTVAELLHHRELEIQRLAALILGQCKSVSRAIHDELVIIAEDGPAVLRRAAISALRPGFENDGDLLEVVTDVLRRSDPTTAAACVKMLLKYDSHPEHLIDALLKSLGSMVSSGSGNLQLGVELLQRIHDEPLSALQQHFVDDPTALAILDEQLHSAEDEAQ